MSIKINDHLDLLFDGDDGYLVDDIHVRGGYTIVDNIVKRDAIPMAARKVNMTVYVATEKREYFLKDSITNSDWTVKTVDGSNVSGVATADSPDLTGIARYTHGERPSSMEITQFHERYLDDTDRSHITISLSDEDKLYIGEGTIVKGSTSGATAVVVGLTPTGIIIPSTEATVSDPVYRAGQFVLGDRLLQMPGAAIARLPEQLITRAALEFGTISKKGGAVYGPIASQPIFRYQAEATIGAATLLNNKYSVVPIEFTDNDKRHVFSGMTITTMGGETVPTLRVADDFKSILIDAEHATKLVPNANFKIEEPILMPTEGNHLSTKQYVDDLMADVNLQLTPDDFTTYEAAYDPLTNQTRKLALWTFPHRYFMSSAYPVIRLLKTVTHGPDTYKYQIDMRDENIRVLFRSGPAGEEVAVEFWDQDPFNCEFILY